MNCKDGFRALFVLVITVSRCLGAVERARPRSRA